MKKPRGGFKCLIGEFAICFCFSPALSGDSVWEWHWVGLSGGGIRGMKGKMISHYKFDWIKEKGGYLVKAIDCLKKHAIRSTLIKMGFDEASLRLLLDKKAVEKLTIKYCSEKVIDKAMESWFFNPVYYYPKGVKRIKGEVGYDDKFRYVSKD